jgi:hypothetical protein
MVPALAAPLTNLGTLPDLRRSFRLILRSKLRTFIQAMQVLPGSVCSKSHPCP